MCAGLCWRLEEGEGEREEGVGRERRLKGFTAQGRPEDLWRSRMPVNTPNCLLFVVKASLSHLIGGWPPHHSHPKLRTVLVLRAILENF